MQRAQPIAVKTQKKRRSNSFEFLRVQFDEWAKSAKSAKSAKASEMFSLIDGQFYIEEKIDSLKEALGFPKTSTCDTEEHEKDREKEQVESEDEICESPIKTQSIQQKRKLQKSEKEFTETNKSIKKKKTVFHEAVFNSQTELQPAHMLFA